MILSNEARRIGAMVCALRFLQGFVPVYPVYGLMFLGRGLDVVSYSVLLALWCAPVVLLEVPSGMLADRTRRARLYAAGMAAKAAGLGLWTAGVAAGPESAFVFALAGFVCWGAQEAICSGTLEAWLYDELAALGGEPSYAAVSGRAAAAERLAVALSMAAGGFLFSLGPLWVLVPSILSCAAAAVFALAIPETRRRPASQDDARDPFRGLAKGARDLFGSPRLLAAVGGACLALGAVGIADEYDALWAVDVVAVALPLVGLWGALRFLCEAAGAWAGGSWAASSPRKTASAAVSALPFGAAVAFAGAAPLAELLPSPGGRIAGAAAYLAAFFLMATFEVAAEARVQAAVESSGRATAMSLYSLLMTALAAAASPFFGFAMGAGGTAALGPAVGLLAAVGSAVLLLGLRAGPRGAKKST